MPRLEYKHKKSKNKVHILKEVDNLVEVQYIRSGKVTWWPKEEFEKNFKLIK